MRSFYHTTIAIVLIVIFAWAGSYLALRTWKGIHASDRSTVVIDVPKSLNPHIVVYQPLKTLDHALTGTRLIFTDGSKGFDCGVTATF